jgi:hypothetical protein
MDFQITTLAETMNATGFIIELNDRGIDYIVGEMDNTNDANDGECTVAIDDMVYMFSDGELYDVSVGVR